MIRSTIADKVWRSQTSEDFVGHIDETIILPIKESRMTARRDACTHVKVENQEVRPANRLQRGDLVVTLHDAQRPQGVQIDAIENRDVIPGRVFGLDQAVGNPVETGVSRLDRLI